jgi:signal transduction histidine kinase
MNCVRAEQARARAAFLAEASRVLASSLDYERTLDLVAQLAIPVLADWCGVDVLARDGSLLRIAAGPADDPAKAALVRELARFGPRLETHAGVGEVILTGVTILHGSITEADLRFDTGVPLPSGSDDPEYRRILRALGLRSYVSVPLRARDRILGALTCCRSRERGHDACDLALAEELGRRAAMAVDNGQLYEEAQQAISIRDEFLGLAAHELRTPCTSLLLAVQALARFARNGKLIVAGGSPGAVTHLLENAEGQAVALGALVDRFLEVARLASGQMTIALSKVDLTEATRVAIARLQESLRRSGSSLAFEAPGPIVGTWDRARIEDVIMNLVSNAIKYGKGAPIEVRVQSKGDVARLTVRDHGIGMEPDWQARVFERFERAVSSRNYGGLGLGLYLVQRICECLGGRVECSSAAGQGSTFTVTLPLAGPPESS